jgi:hypothetical protein
MPNSIDTLTARAAAVGDLVDEVLLTVESMSGPDADVDPRVRTDDRLRELLSGLERVRNAAEATQAEVMVAIGDEARRLDAAEFAAIGLPARSHAEFVPDEVGIVLACTKSAAGRRFALALRAADHPAVAETWSAGLIDARKAQVITDELTALSAVEVSGGLDADEIETLRVHLARAASDHARTHTWSETRAWLRRRVVKVVPEVAELRRGRAEQERKVHITPADDGMSELWAWLPAVDARQIQQALTEAAHELGSNDVRTMDQRRADLLVAWLLGPDHAPVVHLHLVAEAGTSEDSAGEVGAWVPGLGSLTELQSSELLGSARRIVADQAGELRSEPGYRPSAALERAVRARDVTCRFPGCRRAALGTGTGTDLDHTISWPAGPTAASNLAALCRRHHRLKHSPGWRVVLNGDGTMTWTTPTGRAYSSEPWYFTDLQPGRESHADVPDPPPRE